MAKMDFRGIAYFDLHALVVAVQAYIEWYKKPAMVQISSLCTVAESYQFDEVFSEYIVEWRYHSDTSGWLVTIYKP